MGLLSNALDALFKKRTNAASLSGAMVPIVTNVGTAGNPQYAIAGIDSMPNLASVLGGQSAKTLSDLGITTPCKIQDIVNAIPYGGYIVISITATQVTDGKDGELFIWKSSTSSVLHKTHLIIRKTSKASQSLVNNIYIGYLKVDDTTQSNPTFTCLWYNPTLTAVE